jgi:hypothetical protein
MLPDFRFLFAAIALCTSILVFGLGAAALLRAAHEEVAQNPSWRGTPEPRLAQSEEPANPVLAMLRVEPVVAQSKIADAPASAASDDSRRIDAVAPAIAPAIASAMADEDNAVAQRAPDSSEPIETAETEAPSPQTSTPAQVFPAPTAQGTVESRAADTKIAASEQASSATGEQPSAAPVMAPTTAAAEGDPAATKIATLAPPLAALETEAAKAVVEQDREEAKKRLRAERAKERRRLAARRARLAEQAAAQPAIDPFGQLMQQTQLAQQMQPAQLAAAKRKTR